MKISKTQILLLGLLAEIVFLSITFFFMGGGHGYYFPAKIFFPFTMLLTGDKETMPVFSIILGFCQYPIYALITHYLLMNDKKKLYFSLFIILHIVAVVLVFILGNKEFG